MNLKGLIELSVDEQLIKLHINNNTKAKEVVRLLAMISKKHGDFKLPVEGPEDVAGPAVVDKAGDVSEHGDGTQRMDDRDKEDFV